MSAPVNQARRPSAQPDQPQQNRAANRSAPGGVANAPTTVSPAQGNSPSTQGNQAPTGPGYIESGIQFLGVWITWLFKKIFFCFFREDPPEIDNRPPPPRVRPPQLNAELRTQVELLEAVERLTDLQRNRLYRRIGQAVYRQNHVRSWLSSYEQIGRSAVERDPTILRDHLTVEQ